MSLSLASWVQITYQSVKLVGLKTNKIILGPINKNQSIRFLARLALLPLLPLAFSGSTRLLAGLLRRPLPVHEAVAGTGEEEPAGAHADGGGAGREDGGAAVAAVAAVVAAGLDAPVGWDVAEENALGRGADAAAVRVDGPADAEVAAAVLAKVLLDVNG